MKNVLPILLAVLFGYCGTAQPNIDLDLVSSGFNAPVSIRNAGDSRLFIVELDGRIQILNSNGIVNPVPFLDIDSQTVEPGGPGNEGGLLGLAFHPDYSTNGYFFVHYVDNSWNSVISRFEVNSTDPDLADISSETILLTIPQPEDNHNGGDLVFGSDGYLYIAMGDGGGNGDPSNNGQQLNSLLGKILRIDVDSGSPYAVPDGNPFKNDGDANTLAEIWSYGLRNPWRMSFDSLTGELWIGDVGQGNIEEINLAPDGIGGQNYGWRCYEGSNSFNSSGCGPIGDYTFPVNEYTHTGGAFFRCSITGGYRYRGTAEPGLNGIYVFADYCSNEIGMLEFDGFSWQMYFSSPFGNQGFTGFGEDINKELYVVGIVSGNVYRIVESPLSTEDFSMTALKIFPNPADDEFTITFGNIDTYTIELYDITGRLTLDLKDVSNTSVNISTRHLSNGLYIAQLKDSRGNITRKKLVIR
ncbi:MAG: T9SS type A sorting domain-containing protein [Flavobacteriaceae bacterium]|nr:T9SS type A sorting domain-containing protein [Flavobacteriaceae bacterium]